jgi:predicted Na+-dependent transporter
MIPVMFYFLGTQTTSKDLKDTLKNKVTFSFALFFQMFVLPLIGLTLYLVFNSSIFAVSIAIVLLAPGGFISGILTHYKGGNIPLSVSLTFTNFIDNTINNSILVKYHFYKCR